MVVTIVETGGVVDSISIGHHSQDLLPAVGDGVCEVRVTAVHRRYCVSSCDLWRSFFPHIHYETDDRAAPVTGEGRYPVSGQLLPPAFNVREPRLQGSMMPEPYSCHSCRPNASEVLADIFMMAGWPPQRDKGNATAKGWTALGASGCCYY